MTSLPSGETQGSNTPGAPMFRDCHAVGCDWDLNSAAFVVGLWRSAKRCRSCGRTVVPGDAQILNRRADENPYTPEPFPHPDATAEGHR